MSEEHQPFLAAKFKPQFARFGQKLQQILMERMEK
jgi:hypothetical protein